MNLSQNLQSAAFFFPDRLAVREAGTETTYAQLNDRANRIATGLIRLGTKPGDHVGLCAPNSTDWITFYFGVLKAGAVAITLSSVLRRDELTLLLEHSKPRFLFTTGTTGVPKGWMLSHEAINHSSHNIAFSERSSENDRALCFLPFNHVFGQIHIMNSTIMSCGCLEILPSYDMDRVVSLMTAGRVTKFFAVPTLY